MRCFPPQSGISKETAAALFLLRSWCYFFCWRSCRACCNCAFLCFCGYLTQVLTLPDVHAVHALLITYKEASVLKLFAEPQTVAFCTLVNYLHSVPQIWSIVNWAAGNRRGEKHKLCRTMGGSLQTLQDSFKVSFFLVYNWTCRLVKSYYIYLWQWCRG